MIFQRQSRNALAQISMKVLSLFLIVTILTVCRMPAEAQESYTVYRADLLVGNKEKIESKPIEIRLEADRMAIRPVKKNSETT